MLARFVRQLRPERLHPAQHGAVGHVDAALGQQLKTWWLDSGLGQRQPCRCQRTTPLGRDERQVLEPAGAQSASQDPQQLVPEAQPSK